MRKIPRFQDQAESISRMQGQKKGKRIKDLSQGQNQNSSVFPGFQDFQDCWTP